MLDLTAVQENSFDKLQFGVSDEQHLADILRFCKGWHKFAPFVGACLLEALNDETNSTELQARIASELREDGATLRRARLGAEGSIQIDATYG